MLNTARWLSLVLVYKPLNLGYNPDWRTWTPRGQIITIENTVRWLYLIDDSVQKPSFLIRIDYANATALMETQHFFSKRSLHVHKFIDNSCSDNLGLMYSISVLLLISSSVIFKPTNPLNLHERIKDALIRHKIEKI